MAAPTACADAAATAREISPSDAYRADNAVGTGLALVRARISPARRDALNAGQWPELAELLRKVLASGPRYRAEACLLPPPELLPDISAWVKTGKPTDSAYIECAAVLLRIHRVRFDELVSPSSPDALGGASGAQL